MPRAGGFDTGFSAGFSGGNVIRGGATKKRAKRRPPISPEIREREWEEQIVAAGARMAVNRQKAGEAQWRARTRDVPKMSPEYDRIANKKEVPPDYESVIYRLPEDKRRKK